MRTKRTNGIDEAMLMALIDSLPDGVVLANARGEVFFQNLAGARIFDVDVTDENLPAKWADHFTICWPDSGTPLTREEIPMARAFQGERVIEEVVMVKSVRTSEVRHISINAFPLDAPDGTRRGAAVVFRDVSDRRRASEELKHRSHYLHAILDNLPDMAWLKDRESRFLAVNHQLAQAAGLPISDIIGKTDLDIWPRELAEAYRADDREIMAGRSTKRVEEPFVGSDGRQQVIETIKTAIVDENGEVIGSTGMARDISERKRAEEALRDAKESLERRIEERTRELQRAQEISVRKERLAVLGQLAGGVAHQIRNPLAAIKNATYVLEHSLPPLGVPVDGPASRRSSPIFGERGTDGVLRLTPEQQVGQSLAIIHEEIRRANDIISGLLDYARTRAPVRQVVAIRELVSQVLGSAAIPETVQLVVDLEPISAAVDPGQIQEALHVLVRNAVDAMTDGGTLRFSSRSVGPWMLIDIEDTGEGVPPEVVERLFEPLLTTKATGLGLGLVTARTLVEAQGGQLSFVASAHPGAMFEMRLPRGA